MQLIIAWIRTILSLFIILAGILVGTIRLVLPHLANYQHLIVPHLETELDAKIRFDDLQTRLVGLTPELSLTNLSIQLIGQHNSPIYLGKVQVHFDLLGSLIHGKPKLAGIAIHGTRLKFRFVPGEGLTLVGFAASNTEASDIPLDFILNQGSLLLENSLVRLEHPDAKPLKIYPVTVRFIPSQDQVSMQLDAKLNNISSLSFQAHAAVATSNQSHKTLSWHRVHLKIDNIPLNPTITSWLPPNWNLKGTLSAALWGRWSHTQKSLTGHVRLQDITLDSSSIVQRLTTNISMQQDIQGTWQGIASDLSWIRAGKHYDGAVIKLFMPLNSDLKLQLSLANTKLQDIIAHITTLPLPNKIKAPLRSLALHGNIKNLKFNALISLAHKPIQWHLSTQINDFSNTPCPQQQIPAVNNLNLHINASSSYSSKSGSIEIYSNKTHINAPNIFRAPLPALQLHGKLNWLMSQNGLVQINSDNLTLENEDFGIVNRFQVQIPATKSPVILDLQSQFTKGNIAATHHYLPVGVMKQPLIDWLDQALVSGRLTNGQVLLRGPIAEFPFHNREGRFEAQLDLEAVTLKYQKDWPPLKKAMGTIRFIGPGLDIKLRKGQLLNSQITTTHAEVEDIKPASHLPITGQVSGPFTDVLRILRGPLADQQGRHVQGMEVAGQNTAQIKIEIPLESWATTHVDGQLKCNDATLRLNDWELVFDKINGNLHFTDQGLFAKDIKAYLANEPIIFDINTITPAHKQDSVTHIDAKVPINQTSLTTILPTWPWELLKGSAPGNLRLVIGSQQNNSTNKSITYRLQSDLQGLTVNLPEPLRKDHKTIRKLNVTGALPPNIAHQIRVDYGTFKAVLQMAAGDTPRMASGEMLNGTNKQPRSNRNGLHINGKIQRLDILGWIALYDHYETDIHNYLKTQNTPIRTQARLQIGTLGLPGEPLRNIKLVAKQLKTAWQLTLRSKTATGKIRIPNNPRRYPIQGRFKHLLLTFKKALKPPPLPFKYTTPSNPRRASGLDLYINNLQIDSQTLGRFLIQARPTPTGLKISQFLLNGPYFAFNGYGHWIGDPKNQKTQLFIKGQSSDLGQALRDMGINSGLQQSYMQIQANIDTPHSIYSLTSANLNGILKFKLGKGRIANVSPGVGRFFGLLNLEAIQRRLALDFNDVFGKGFAFNAFGGEFTLKNGNAITSGIKITGPAADIIISGRTGLATQDYNQTVVVIPELSSTLPIAGAVTGGPIGAAAMLLANQVLGDQVNKLISFQYKLTGSWKNPVLVQSND
ncbi:hypothetical protein TI05_05485 [Achromatium sp. WMS3]|nr:hypothetical protein TI05_05485 [Achromatium sp. WMS3]